VALWGLRGAAERPWSLRGVLADRPRQVREAIVERLSAIGVDLPGPAGEPAPADEPSGGR
jgi:hypothetical protein